MTIGEGEAVELTLKLNGVGRAHDQNEPNQAARVLEFYFNRRPTDDELRFLHECMGRSVSLVGLR
jgi:hypothetical protein